MTQSTDTYNVSTEKQFEQFCSLLTAMPDIEPLLQTLLMDRHYPYPQRSEFMLLLKDLPCYVEKISQYPFDDYRFSPSIEAFITALKHCGLPLSHSQFNMLCVAPYYKKFSSCKPYLMDLLSTFQSALQSSEVKLKRIAQQNEAQRNCEELAQYIDQIFSQHSTLLIIRIDLSFLKQLDITLDKLEADLKHFHSNKRYHPLLKEMLGYITKIEYGIDKKLHIHALFIFNGNDYCKDVSIAQVIGDYWINTITVGHGIYFNCNHNKDKYTKLGIGAIKHDDTEKRNNLIDAISYLCKKSTQVIKPHHAPMTKLLRRGQFKVSNSPKLGRHRIESQFT